MLGQNQCMLWSSTRFLKFIKSELKYLKYVNILILIILAVALDSKLILKTEIKLITFLNI